MEDKVFGNLTFNHGWVKKETVDLLGKQYVLDIRTSSYPNQVPNEKQQAAYQQFEANKGKINDLALVKLAQFIMTDDQADITGGLESVINKLPEHIQPEEILFFQDGSYAIECVADWNDDGIAILIDGDNIKIGYCDELLDRKI